VIKKRKLTPLTLQHRKNYVNQWLQHWTLQHRKNYVNQWLQHWTQTFR